MAIIWNVLTALCDQPHLQPLLRQYIVGNEYTLPKKAMPHLDAACPGYVRLLRRNSAWVNTPLFVAIIRGIMADLEPYLAPFRLILSFAALPVHIASEVFTVCASLGAWPVSVPARMTWLLQVLGTHFPWVKSLHPGAIPGCTGVW
mgnify:CR=1 FL=1